ncbi:MAG: glycosyltransferase family 2 protein [Deltaproteobacteria bacterium]|nr:glycosyltransferase family 2 protein [Deltaproteobacteria bacterium]
MLSVVIPAYNEERRIVSCLQEVARFLHARPDAFEVIIVDDGSTDSTVEKATGFAARDPRFAVLSHGSNRGKGAALRTGIAATRGNRVLLTDADLSTPLDELPLLEQPLDEGAIVAIGSRGLPASRLVRRQSRLRELAGRGGNLLIRLLCPELHGIRDTQCGFKLFDGPSVRELCRWSTLVGFGFDVELLLLARRRKLPVREIPVTWAHHDGSKVTGRAYVATLFEVVRVRINLAAGRYPHGPDS